MSIIDNSNLRGAPKAARVLSLPNLIITRLDLVALSILPAFLENIFQIRVIGFGVPHIPQEMWICTPLPPIPRALAPEILGYTGGEDPGVNIQNM